MYCWNEDNGCGVVLPASQLPEHLRQDCQHHVTRCPTCSAAVLSRDVCAHLKSRCTTLALHGAPGPQQGGGSSERTNLVAFEVKLEHRVLELDAKLAQLSMESTSQSDKIMELCHTINHLKEGLTEHVVRASEHNVAEMKAIYKEARESFMTSPSPVVISVPRDQIMHQRVLTGYAALKQQALKDGFSLSISDEVYLHRYLITWGISFRKDGECVNLFLCLQLHEGREDEFLDWPFTKKVKLTFIHPETRQELHRYSTPDSEEYTRVCYCRPIGGSNRYVRFTETWVQSSDVEREGYVKNDQLLLRFAVLV